MPLTNERLEEISESVMKALGVSSSEVQIMADRLLAAEAEVKGLRRERENMHSIEYVQGLLVRTNRLEAQLAELRGQEPVEYKIVDPFGEITLRREKCEADMYSEMDTWSVTPLYASPIPPAASQPCEMRETLYRIANHIAGAKSGMPEEWRDWADEVETDIRRVSDAVSQPYTVPDEVMRVLGFFASVIKSGEQWTSVCQNEYDTAIAACRAAMIQNHFPGVRKMVSDNAAPQHKGGR
ncbi:hypothetical protein [Pectobacterium brasiliense]|uniref:hypothetical protein n=1 Tax=Pectobacterium brasiliense TaxID=180957 RepID=UPI0039887C2E